MRPIIKVENLSKQYRIGALPAGYVTFRETVADAFMAALRRAKGAERRSNQKLWALKDLSFEIEPGEVVGLIGHNGAGKSTLLKILARIVQPTAGRFELYGRVGSLLEVGTGFHPELTGRDNVFLNGAILGMKRAMIERKFDEIVAFSEIQDFIETPVKWYSSGMYLRLAFSVAVHMDTEILFVDEILAVGDVGFQQKCMDKIQSIMRDGRTIIFVSHSMPAITRLCKRVIWIDRGHLMHDGPAHDVIETYLGSAQESATAQT
ncbi:MAG: ABC transporter ATP-binding protein [Pyrinomonadaceae bacterium]